MKGTLSDFGSVFLHIPTNPLCVYVEDISNFLCIAIYNKNIR